MHSYREGETIMTLKQYTIIDDEQSRDPNNLSWISISQIKIGISDLNLNIFWSLCMEKSSKKPKNDQDSRCFMYMGYEVSKSDQYMWN